MLSSGSFRFVSIYIFRYSWVRNSHQHEWKEKQTRYRIYRYFVCFFRSLFEISNGISSLQFIIRLHIYFTLLLKLINMAEIQAHCVCNMYPLMYRENYFCGKSQSKCNEDVTNCKSISRYRESDGKIIGSFFLSLSLNKLQYDVTILLIHWIKVHSKLDANDATWDVW